jgi:hypothetical protein
MNKTVEVMKYYDPYLSIDNASYLARIDVELENAVDFSTVPLKASHGRISIDKSAKLLKSFKNSFRNITVKENLNRNLIQIDFENIEILFGQKLEESETSSANQTSELRTSEGSRIFTDVSVVTKVNLNLGSSSKRIKVSKKTSPETTSTKSVITETSSPTSISTKTKKTETTTKEVLISTEKPTTKIPMTEPTSTPISTTISSSSSSTTLKSSSTSRGYITKSMAVETTLSNLPITISIDETSTSNEIISLFSTNTIPIKNSSNAAKIDPLVNLPKFTSSLKIDSTSLPKDSNYQKENQRQSTPIAISATPSMLTSHPAEDLVMDLIVDPELLKSVLDKDPSASSNINNEIENLFDQFLKEKQQSLNESSLSQSRQLVDSVKYNLDGLKQIVKRSKNSMLTRRFKKIV